jgi:hypothetical protein
MDRMPQPSQHIHDRLARRGADAIAKASDHEG